MYKRILVPIDGSTTSDRALREAIKLIDAQLAQLHLVHVVDDLQFLNAEGYVDYAELRELTRQIGERALCKAAEIARQIRYCLKPPVSVSQQSSTQRRRVGLLI
ncbi:MAG: universal stress protein [Gallionella sp.]